MTITGCIAILAMLVSMVGVAQPKKSDGIHDVSPLKLERMPQSLEVRYALSQTTTGVRTPGRTCG